MPLCELNRTFRVIKTAENGAGIWSVHNGFFRSEVDLLVIFSLVAFFFLLQFRV